jgi:hypothetical protein
MGSGKPTAVPMRILRLVTLLFTALITGLAFAHTLELPQKLGFDAQQYVQVQHTLYAYFAYVGAPVEVAAIVCAVVLAYLVRDQPGFGWTVTGAFLLAAGLAAWALIVQPANVEFGRWTAETIPADWTKVRNRWEAGHVVHFVLFFAGLATLAWGGLQGGAGAGQAARRARTGRSTR